MNSLSEIESLNKLTNLELKNALEEIYPIRDNLQKTLIETFDEELLDKVVILNRVIKNAEALINMDMKRVKAFYVDKYPDYIDENKQVNEKGIERISILKKKWKKLGYLKKID